MTPKEKYELEKARRKARREYLDDRDRRDDDMQDLLERFVLAVESIALALSKDTDND